MEPLRISAYFLEDRNNACPTLRILSPLKKLQEQGMINLAVGTHMVGSDVDININIIANSDIVIIQRQAARKELSEDIFKLTERLGIKVIMEVDDLLIKSPPSHIHKQVLNNIKDDIIQCMEKADAVTCTTPLLKRQIMQYARRIFILPNFLDLDIWKNDNVRKRSRGKKTVIAYVGTPTHTHDIHIITPAIKDILKRYDGEVEFRFWGCCTDELAGTDGVVFEKELVPDYREYAGALRESDIDIALCPLAYNEFNKCKSNIKFLEFSICGIPGIFSRIEPYSSSVEHLKTGILTENTKESWISSIELLLQDHSLSSTIAKNARTKVTESYSLHRNVYRWEAVLNQVSRKTQFAMNSRG